MPPPGASPPAGHLARLVGFARSDAAFHFYKMFAGLFGRLVVQMGYFLVLARYLGPADYGVFTSTVAVMTILGPLGAIGSETTLTKALALDRTRLGEAWGLALGNLAVGTPLALLIGLIVIRAVLPNGAGIGIVLAIGVSELVFARSALLVSAAHMALYEAGRSSWIQLAVTLARAAAALALVLLHPQADLDLWCLSYAGATAAVGVLAQVPLWRRARPRFAISRAQLGEGFQFALSSGAQSAYNEVDKAIIPARLSFEAGGIYAAAARIIDASFLPLQSLTAVVFPRFFQHGAGGVRASSRFALRLAPLIIAYGIAVPIGMAILAPYVPTILGAKYKGVAPALMWLSVMPLLTGGFYVAADVLTSTGRQTLRGLLQLALVAVKIPISLGLIALYGFAGAIWAVLLSSVLLLLLTIGLVAFTVSREPAPAAP